MSRAIAVSTWFHGSQCPPRNQGIMPLGQLELGDGGGGVEHLGRGEHAGEVGEVVARHELAPLRA